MTGYEAALRSDRYPADVFGKDCVEVPGQPLASDLAHELERLQGVSVEVVDESPLWIVRVPANTEIIDVIVLLYQPDPLPLQAIWNVSVCSRRGILDKVFRRPEPEPVVCVVKAVHAALGVIPGIRDVRWFSRWPGEPYASSAFAPSPVFP